MKIRVKYLEGATKMKKIAKGNWIDVYAYEDKFVPEGESAMINLGFALDMPENFEGHLAPRSSTFKTWGIIQTNSMGVIDGSYCGDNDEWRMPVYATRDTVVEVGDRICQFRIMENQPKITFEAVEHLGGADRGGFGTTGSN